MVDKTEVTVPEGKTSSWLDVSIPAGELALEQRVKVVLVISSNANGLSVGSYTDTVKFINKVDDVGTNEVDIVLDVAAEPPRILHPT